MKYTVILYATHQDKEYWEVDLPSGTDIEAVARQIHDDPYVVIRELEGDMVDSDPVETVSMHFSHMYNTLEAELDSLIETLKNTSSVNTVSAANELTRLRAERDRALYSLRNLAAVIESDSNNEQFRNGTMK